MGVNIGNKALKDAYIGDKPIKQIYLGDKLLWQKYEYIQDGLVFQLDCADYNPTLNTWVDKIGGVSFAMSNVTVDSLGGVVFNGTNSKGVASVGLNNPVNTSTIEVAIYVRANKSQFVLESGVYNTIMYGFHNSTTTCLCNMSNTTKYYNTIPITTGFIANSVHYGSSPANIVNGNVGSFASSGTYWSKNGSVAYLGARSNNAANYYMNGIIYQIRIYNRLLTADEMIRNQRIDMQKYI